MAWFIDDIDGTRLVRHGGATNGQISSFLMAPGRRFAMTILTNSDRGGELNLQVAPGRHCFPHLGIDEKDPEPIETGAEQLREYEGLYLSPLNHLVLTVAGNRLVVDEHSQGGFPTPDSPTRAGLTAGESCALGERLVDRAG